MQILAGLILLAVLIVFHELGHFLFAKMLGVRVLVFSLGFGPKLLSVKIGDTEYRLSAIPLGGYVRMFGESIEEELSDEEKKRSFIHQAIWRKSLIAVAGPLFNFILPVILFFALLMGTEQVYVPMVGTLLKDSVAEKAGLMPDDRIIEVDGQKIQTFTDLAQRISDRPGQELELRVQRPSLDEPLTIKLTPESKSAQSPFDKGKMVGRIGIMPAIEKPVVMVEKHSAFYEAGLRDYDEINAINGVKIPSMHALRQALKDLPANSVFTVARQDGDQKSERSLTVARAGGGGKFFPQLKIVNNLPEGESAQMPRELIDKTGSLLATEAMQTHLLGLSSAQGAIVSIKPLSTAALLDLNAGDRLVAVDGEKISSDLQLQQSLMQDPKAPHVIGVLSKNGELRLMIFRLADNLDENMKLDADLSHIFGITMAPVFKAGEFFTRKVGAGEALERAFSQTYAIAAMTGKSLWMLISGAVPASQVGGPIMIFDVAQQAAHKGFSYYIFIMCLLSVNLGLLNLLPIPALDGGHLLLFGVEAVQRKPLTPKTRAIATQIGIALLLGLMALAIFNDLYRLFK